MAGTRTGQFRASLSPFGTGRLSLDSVYTVGVATGEGPPVPAEPPPRDTTPGAGAGSPGAVKPAKIGKTPNPKTTAAKKAPVKKAAPKPVAAKAKPQVAVAKARRPLPPKVTPKLTLVQQTQNVRER